MRAAEARRRASGGSRRGHGARRRATRSAGVRAAPGRTRVLPIRIRPSIAYGTPSAPSAVSSCARTRSTLGQTTRISSGFVPAADELQDLVGDELERAARAGSFEETDRAVERRPRRGPVGEEVALEVRERREARSRRSEAASSSMRPAARELRSSDVRRRDSNGARFGSYGSETVTSVRPESAFRRAHCAPVRSSNPYAKTGRPVQASSSAAMRSAA